MRDILARVRYLRKPLLELYAQEINPSTFAIAKMNAAIHEMQDETALGVGDLIEAVVLLPENLFYLLEGHCTVMLPRLLEGSLRPSLLAVVLLPLQGPGFSTSALPPPRRTGSAAA